MTGVHSGGGGLLNVVEGIHQRTLAGILLGLRRHRIVLDHGNVIHADPALFRTAPLGGAAGLHFQNLDLRTRQQLAHSGIADARPLTDVHAGIGVGNDTGAGAVGGDGISGGIGNLVGILNGAHTDIQVLGGNPAILFIVIDTVLVGIQLVPLVLLGFPDANRRSTLQGTGHSAVESAGFPDTHAVGIDNSRNQPGIVIVFLLLLVQLDLVRALDILGCQVDPAGLRADSAGIDRVYHSHLAPDVLVHQANQADLNTNALIQGKGQCGAVPGSLPDIGGIGNNRVVHGIQNNGEAHRVSQRIVCQGNGNPAASGNRNILIVLILLRVLPGHLRPGRVVAAEGSDGQGAELDILGAAGDIIAGIAHGIRIGNQRVGVAGSRIDVHIRSDLASERVGSNAVIGDRLAADHGHRGVGQADPARVALAPAVTVDGLDLVKLNSIILIQRADNLVVGTGAVADIQVAIVGNHRGCDHVTAHGIRLGSADADPAAQCDGVAPTVAGLVDEVIVDLHGTGSLGAERGCLGIRIGVNLGGDQFLFGDGIVRCRSSGPGVVSLPVGIQDLAGAVLGQLGHPLVVGGVPAQENFAAVGRLDVVYFLTGVIAHGVSVAIALGNLTTVRIILDRLEIAGNGVGVHTVDVHIDFHLMTLILTVVQVLHNTQQLVGAGLAENGALQGAGAGEPGCARAMAVDHQRVMLILG